MVAENAKLTEVAKAVLTRVVANVVHLMVETKKVENVNHLTAKVVLVVAKDALLTNQVEKDLLAETAKEQNVESVLLNNFS
jgi:hypothetical protein